MIISIISLTLAVPGCIVAIITLLKWIKRKTAIKVFVNNLVNQEQSKYRAFKITIQNNLSNPISLQKIQFYVNDKPYEVMQKLPLRDYSCLSIKQILSNDSIWTIGYLDITNETILNKNKFVVFTDYGTFSGKIKQS